MADDKKISEFTEITAGQLTDDMQLEVYDPDEALAEDQNKRIKFVTLEGIFGAEDKIFEGDSSVEVVDAGTGEIIITVDGGEVGHYNASGLQLGGAGARVDTIETALTDDDTHLPSSGAVVDALAADVKDIILEGNSSIEVIDAGAGQVLVTVDGNPIFDVLAAGLAFATGARVDTIETALTDDDTHLPTSGAVIDAISAFNSDKIEELNSSVEVIDAGTGQVLVTVDGNPIYDVLAAGLAFATGSRVNEIEATLTDDDTHIPTSGAVVDAIAAGELGSLFFGGNAKITAKSDGVEIEGPSAQILHIDAATGTFSIESQGSIHLDLRAAQKNSIKCRANAGIWFYYNNVEKARIGADSLELKDDQSGAEAIGNAATTAAITFGTAHADANYQVICTVENTTDVTPLVLAAIITAKATTGFTATLSAATDSANYVLNWLVVRDY